MFRFSSRRQPATGVIDLDDLRGAMGDALDHRAGAVLRIVSLLLDVDRAGEAALAREALALVSAEPRVVRRLDEMARGAHWAPVSRWVADAAERMTTGAGGVIAASLASMHPDGRVREVAVARLLTVPAPELVPFLVVRTADWVRQVREQARGGLALLLHDEPARYLPAALPTAALVAGRRRADFAGSQVSAALHTVPVGVLRELAECRCDQTRRAAISAGLVRRALPLVELVAAAQRDRDLVVRLRTAEAAAREALWTSRHDVLRTLAGARMPQVRALGLTGLVRAGQTAVAADHLADDNAIVRALARDAARRLGRDPAAWYRSVVATDAPPPTGALAGLGETGTAADADLVYRWLDHPSARARTAVVRALRQLDSVVWDHLLPALEDPAWPVTREAATALRPHVHSMPPERLWRLLTAPAYPTRRAAYLLLRTLGGWVRLRANLFVVDDSDPTLAQWGRADVRRWVDGERPPDGPAPDDIGALIGRAASLLDSDTVTLLRARLAVRPPGRPAG